MIGKSSDGKTTLDVRVPGKLLCCLKRISRCCLFDAAFMNHRKKELEQNNYFIVNEISGDATVHAIHDGSGILTRTMQCQEEHAQRELRVKDKAFSEKTTSGPSDHISDL